MAQAEVVLKPELQGRLGGDIKFLPARHSLGAGACSTTGKSSYGCSLSAPGDGADDGAGDCASAHVLAGALVFADAFLTGGNVSRCDFVPVAVHTDRTQVDGEVVPVPHGRQCCGRAAGDQHIPVPVLNVFADPGGVGVGSGGVIDVRSDGLIGADWNLGAAGNGGALGAHDSAAGGKG